jgi:hypothetical protein
VSGDVTLPEHVVFRELPFCGILLDTRRSLVFRLTQEAAGVLRHWLHGADTPGPYEPVIIGGAPPSREQRDVLLDRLSSQGLVRVRTRDGDAR